MMMRETYLRSGRFDSLYRVFGWLLILEAILMLLPLAVCLLCG